jgi:hypothetical protein
MLTPIYPPSLELANMLAEALELPCETRSTQRSIRLYVTVTAACGTPVGLCVIFKLHQDARRFRIVYTVHRYHGHRDSIRESLRDQLTAVLDDVLARHTTTKQ